LAISLHPWPTGATDPNGRLTQVEDPLGGLTTTLYDKAGNLTAVTDPLGHTTTYLYDALDRRTVMIDPLGDRATTVYDPAGNVTSATDVLGTTTSFAYDAAARPVESRRLHVQTVARLAFSKSLGSVPIRRWSATDPCPGKIPHSARVACMAKPSVLAPPTGDVAAFPLPVVRLEVQGGSGHRPTLYEVGEGGFLIGSVPGCDLRLPGANLPPVMGLIVRHAGGAGLRKLAPVQPVAVNGRTVTSTLLNSGDKIAIGPVEIVVHVGPVAQPHPEGAHLRHAEQQVNREAGPLAAREAKLGEYAHALETERAAWAERRAEIEAECRRQTEALEQATVRLRREQQDLGAVRARLAAREQAWREGREELKRLRAQLGAGGDETSRQAGELLAWRKELEQLKHRLHERFRQKRDRLVKMGQAVRRAALRVQRKKREVEVEAVHLSAGRQDTAEGQTELEAKREQFERERRVLDDQHRIITARQQQIQREMAARLADVEGRERKLVEEKSVVDKAQKQHQADLVRIDRTQALLDQRQKQLQERAREVDRRSEQLQRAARELEEQAGQVDELRERLTREDEAFGPRKKELDELRVKLDERAGALESQQTMLATLRTRVERMRDDLRHQEQALSEQRIVHEQTEADLRRRAEEAEQLRLESVSAKELFEQERRRFEEQRATLDHAVAELRKAQEAQASAEARLRERQQELDATAVQQAEQAGVLLARGQQLEELNARAAADRQALGERETALARAETTLASLQEQLRRRDEELAERERRLNEETQRHDSALREWEAHKKLGSDSLDALRVELSNRTAQVEALAREVSGREEFLTADRAQVDEESRALAEQRQGQQSERVAFELEKQEAAEAAARHQADFEAARALALEIGRQLPDLEARGAAAVERLQRGREQLREQLAELHAYTRQTRADLEAARRQLHSESERARQMELELHSQRDEHRVAVAGFRQQLVEWQGHLTEMRHTLTRGESQLDRRQAEVEQRARQVAAVREELAQQAEQLHEAERAVAQQRGEMTRHLSDMREWYRKKMRELSGIDTPPTDAGDGEPDVVRLPVAASDATRSGEHLSAPGDRGILALTGNVDPGDRQLGDQLRSLELIDADTLTALLLDARRQRRSLRQLLLAGNYLTLYQLALIEAGNLDGLVLGPVRVIDRLRATPREVAYRVFDPRRNREALLRHLGEGEMLDAVRPDEFRQRFAAVAALQHAHVAATFEVLEIAGRPAVLQEWLNGVPSSDWPALAAAPGVWYRLVSQAALALRTAHAAGLVHGHLRLASFVLTGEGVLKLTGLGEPHWLIATTTEPKSEATAAGDLAALGRVAAEWAATRPGRAGVKSKPLPGALQEILRRMNADRPGERFDSAGALLQALDQAGGSVPANTTAWERFVKQVRDQSEDVALRQTA
jgi:YD repeat-containing protein